MPTVGLHVVDRPRGWGLFDRHGECVPWMCVFTASTCIDTAVTMSSSADGETMQKITAETLQVPTSLAIRQQQQTNVANTRKVTLQSYVDTIKEGFRKLSGCKDQDSKRKSRDSYRCHSDRESRVLQTPERRVSENLQKQLSRDLEKKYGSEVERRLSREVERKLSHCHDESEKQAVLSTLIKKISIAEDHTDRKISFESYLRSIPRLDPVDRTIGWIVQQPDDNNDSPVIVKNLPLRGTLIPNPKPAEEFCTRTDSESSISRCESARGTPNRGTPPPLDDNQPRLDEWLQELLRCHQHTQRRRGSCTNTSNTTLGGYQMHNSDSYPCNPEITADIVPFLINPAGEFPTPACRNPNPYIRGTYQAPYNSRMHPKNINLSVPLEYSCRWRNCHQRFGSSKELFIHVESDHLCTLPICQEGETELYCQWRGCLDSGKSYPARYKLLVHLQNAHCKDRHLKSAVSEFKK